MAFKAGTATYFALDNAAGSLTNIQPYTDSVSLPQAVQTLDVTAFGTGSQAFIPGLQDGQSIDVSGPYDVTLHTHLTGVKAAQAAGTASFTFEFGPGGSVASQAKVTGECLLSNYSLSSSVSGRVEWSASLQITGAVTNSTY